MANEKLKENIIRAACDVEHFLNEYEEIQTRWPSAKDKFADRQIRKLMDERNVYSDGHMSALGQMRRFIRKLKSLDPSYD